MKTKGDWLAASSFERTHEVLSAINTLSIHAKLHLAGARDPASEEEVKAAREHLLGFLSGLDELLIEAEQEDDRAVVGADPRMVDLARRYLSARKRWPRPSVVFELPIGELSSLVRSEREEDLPRLVECLRGLRMLLEQHSVADTAGILGDL